MQDLLFQDLTAEEQRKVEAARRQSKGITLVRHFGKPAFKIDAELDKKRIEISININGKSETSNFGQEQFFGVLTEVYGEEPIVPWDKLLERYDRTEF